MPSVLNLKFSYRFQDPVWETKATDSLLIVNTRNSDSLHSAFSLINLQEAALLWENLRFEEEWWVSVYHMTDEIIVFQQFEDSQNIDDRTLFGFDPIAQESLWSLENVHVTGANGNQLYMNWEEDQPLIFNVQKKDWEEERLWVEEAGQLDYPVHYEEDNPYFDTLAKFLKLKTGIELTGSCDYLEWKGLIIIAANHVIAGKKSLTLYVFEDNGQLLMEESLESGAKGLVSGAFFIAREALIFVTGKNELKIYSINEKV